VPRVPPPPPPRLLAAAALALTGAAAAAEAAGPLFEDRAAAWGLDFVHFNGMSGEFYFPEIMGSGAALLDYDGDGDLDAFLVQGAMLGGKPLAQATFPPEDRPPRSRLYRNDLRPGGEPRFVDVTAESGIDARGYGVGVAVGDVDNDGRPDLYVTNFGPDRLWRNRGDGTFEDATAKAGLGDPRWSSSAAFFDYDADGWLDLFVVHYVRFDLEKNPRCFTPSSRRDWCGPSAFEPLPDRLLRNRGDGTFEDVSARAGIAAKAGPGLGVAAEDFDGDGDLDVFVANDGAANFLWLNRGDGTFAEDGLFAGVALNRNGAAEASMGVAVGDADEDGDLDLFLTHLAGETNTLYVNRGGGVFEDRSFESGLAAPSVPDTAFGAGFLDVDNDGRLDLLAVNGAVRVLEPLARAGDPYPVAQPDRLFENLGGGRFADATAEAGPALTRPAASRGAAFGDVDNDGDTDVLVNDSSGPARLLVNRAGAAAPWLGLRLVDRRGRDAIGARVAVERDGAPPLVRRADTGGSYASASDPRVPVGLGGGARVAGVRVRWPGGAEEAFAAPPLGRYTTLVEGAGRRIGGAAGTGRDGR
jgi:hypothetical protein